MDDHVWQRVLTHFVAAGSAVYKSFFPCLLSSSIYVILFNMVNLQGVDNEIFLHPYPMGALISALTFLLAFRANFSYNRYWESVTAVHQMHSKWLDVGMQLAAFHLQSAIYDSRRPPAFGQYPEINSLERARERLNEPTLEELEVQLDEMGEEEIAEQVMAGTKTFPSLSFGLFRRKKTKSREMQLPEVVEPPKSQPMKKRPPVAFPIKSINAVPPLPFGTTHHSSFSSFSHWITLKSNSKTTSPDKQVASNLKVQAAAGSQVHAWDLDKPPLFLQEAAHLLSLLSAVAFSTLRNDLEQATSPLITFTAGAPWPHVDPDAYTADVRKDWANTGHRTVTVIRYISGWSRTPKSRTMYNAARPFRVIGGVSDAEIELLQAARGPLAKVALVTMWLQEFISREYLAGSTGNVATPIISRLYQFTSDGMIGYNQARKIAYIPFPFPHAQITSLFVLIVVGLMPVLMLSYLTNVEFGFVLNLLTVMCFAGLHEVARELESPFQNVPNDVPLNNFQAQFNEALLTMFSGFHPDAFWQVVRDEEKNDHKPSGPPAPKDRPSTEASPKVASDDTASPSALNEE
jgi:predicted membrane chloride channel (bestrophin family)